MYFEVRLVALRGFEGLQHVVRKFGTKKCECVLIKKVNVDACDLNLNLLFYQSLQPLNTSENIDVKIELIPIIIDESQPPSTFH